MTVLSRSRPCRVIRNGAVYDRSSASSFIQSWNLPWSSSAASSYRNSTIWLYCWEPVATRLPIAVGGSVSTLAQAAELVMDHFSRYSSGIGSHQLAVVEPPVPLGIVLRETIVDVAATRPVRRFF